MINTYYIPLGKYIDSLWPKNILEPPPVDQISKIWIEPLRIETEPELNIKTSILLEQELSLAIPGIDGVSIVLAAAGNDSAFLFEFFTTPSPGMRVIDIPIAIRFASDLLTPAKLVTSADGSQLVQADESLDHVDITLARITLTAGFDGGFGIEAEGGIDLPLCLIGDTGVGIEARGIRFVGANDVPPAGKPAGWNGIHIPNAGLWLPGELGSIVGHLTLTDATIGNGGFSGTVASTWEPELSASLGGMDLKLKSVAITFIQNSFTDCEILGTINLPFFDEPVDVELGINLDGSFAVKLASENGLLTLSKPGVFEIELQSIGFSWVDGIFTAALSGKLIPLIGGLDWPAFEVRELSIDSHGNVKIAGGWIDLRDGYSLDFHGFKIEISRIGFGKTDDGGKWIGFSGGLNLVDGFAAGASVDGLKITWYEGGANPVKLTLDGVGVEFLVPDAVSFKGQVSYREFNDPNGNLVHQFSGAIKLSLLALGMEIDAVLVIGSALKPDGHTYTFFAIYIAVELPAGIPLWTTGLGLYGLAGLFAIQMEPDKHSDEPWYGVGPADGWYKRPTIGVTDLGGKWRNQEGSLALGAGLTIGTVADNGFTFCGRMLLVLVFPGPVLMIEGKANLLKERTSLSDEPLFRALAVLDGRSGTLLFGLDAQYKAPAAGELIDIAGGAEAFFDFHDYDRWHIYLGINEPREKRVRARIFNLFEANAYFMIDAHSLRTGAWIGYDKQWSYGPVRITLEAWLEANASLNWNPVQFHGDIWAHGKVGMRVFGFGFGLTLDARIAGDVFTPFHILAELSVELNLPWPIPNVDVDFSLEWGGSISYPPIPLVLKEVAIEHMKVTTSWPLPRARYLLPDYDSDKNGFFDGPAGPLVPGDLSVTPVVPVDCRPHITFSRPVHDAALIGNNPQPPIPSYERIGDPSSDLGPARVRYSLTAITLEKFSNGTWTPVARKSESTNPPGLPELFGSWAPVPSALGGSDTQSVGQVKLWIWSKNPFDYTRNTSGTWDEWFTDSFPSYPCIPDAPSRSVCCSFVRYPIGNKIDVPHQCDQDMLIYCYPPKLVDVKRISPAINGIDRAASFKQGSFMQVRFKFPPKKIDVRLLNKEVLRKRCIDFAAHGDESDQNSLFWQSAIFTVFDKDGSRFPTTTFIKLNGFRLLNAGYRTDIKLPEPVITVQLTLVWQVSKIQIKAIGTNGEVAAYAETQGGVMGQQIIVLNGKSIMELQITAVDNHAFIQKVCYTATGDASVRAVADFANGSQSEPIFPVNGHIIVRLKDVVALSIRGEGEFYVVEVCAYLGPDPQEVLDRQEMATHLQNTTALWSQSGSVLESNVNYRIRINTRAEAMGEGELAGWTATQNPEEFAYFRTEGPPGLTNLTRPFNQVDQGEFLCGLENLDRYIRQTVPATVPQAGEKPLLPKPVYRSYDVGVEFNEDYVDLMYRISGRDLDLLLFDNNNLPVRDAAGRLFIRQGAWQTADTLIFDATEQRWIQVVNTGTCALINESIIPKDVKLIAGAAGQVLKADAVHEARLLPVLLHETFYSLSAGTIANGPAERLGRWSIVDQGVSQGPSQWQVAETSAPVMKYVVQNRNIWSGTMDRLDPVKPGSMLIYGSDPNLPASHADQPENWTDYQFTVFLRNEDNDAIGVVFRYIDKNNLYRFSMDAERQYRRLVRVVNGIHTILSEDDRVYQLNTDYALTVEAIGASLKVYMDGECILVAEDRTHTAGGIGLYCWASEKARFSDIKVHDLRNADPVTQRPAPVYKFAFTTSKFAHFTHHVQSYDDIIWMGNLDGSVDTAAWVNAANIPGSPVTEEESRAFNGLASSVLNNAANQFTETLEVIRVAQNGHTVGFLLQTSEPFDWPRIDLTLYSAELIPGGKCLAPGILKIIAASFATNLPREELVSLVTRDSIDLRGYGIDVFRTPGPIKASVESETLFEDFDESGHGFLFEESFGPNSLDRYTIFNQAGNIQVGEWVVSGGEIVQVSNIGVGNRSPEHNVKLGTMAVTGNAEWSDIRIRAKLMSTDNDGIGIVFRFLDAENYYRFSTDNERNYRRLVKCEKGLFITLWEDMKNSYLPGIPFNVQIDSYGSHLIGQLNNMIMFDVMDDSFKKGQIGFYSWLNIGARFQALRVDSLDAEPVLTRPNLSSLNGWLLLDPDGSVDGPSVWTADPAGIRQTSLIRVEDVAHSGAHLITGQSWDDFQFSVTLRSQGEGAMGILIRYQDKRNYYRFSMNRPENYLRLEKLVDGIISTLWQTTGGYEHDQAYQLAIQLRGGQIRGILDEQVIFEVADISITRGSVGLYSWNNNDSTWSQAWVFTLAAYVNDFRIQDAAGLNIESCWQTRFGGLQQRAMTGGPGAPYPGTQAIAPTIAGEEMRLKVQGRSDSTSPFGVIFRYQDERNYYRFAVSTADHMRQLIKMVDGVVTVLSQSAGGYSPGNMHSFMVDIFSNRIVGYFDNEKQFDVSDSSFSSGRVGLYTSRNNSVAFDMIRITTPPLEAYALFTDKFINNDITDWTFISEAVAGNNARWRVSDGVLTQFSNAYSPPTAGTQIEKKGLYAIAGDPAWKDVVYRARLQSNEHHAIGVMFRYQNQTNYYRFSMDNFHRYRRLIKNVNGVFSVLWEDEFAFEVKTSYEIVIIAYGTRLYGFIDTVPMFAVEDGELASGQIGIYCWRNPGSNFSCIAVLPVEAAFSDWAFKDNFPYLVRGKWSFIDAGETDTPSEWKVENNCLTQLSGISGDQPWKGTFAVSDKGSRDWIDYRFSVNISSADTGVIGVVARFQDELNHYRFEIEWGTSVQRLLKMVEGVEVVLWKSLHVYKTDVMLLATIQCMGERITCYINGHKLCEVSDTSVQAGRVAIFTFNNIGARFNYVRVQEASWQRYYTFVKQPTVPAGHRLRVFACPDLNAPATIPNTHDEFIAGTGEQGNFHFYGETCDLRIVDPRGNTEQQRTFIRAGAFTEITDIRILRRQDGCGFFIALPAAVTEGSRFDEAEYRLVFSYRLDNTAFDAKSQIQHEAGSSEQEATGIDL